ncbi:hypothetical protein [Rhizobium binxianense]
MKASVVTSAVLHGLVLTWALVTIGAPESFKVEDFEAMPVDLVPVESITQMQQGDKKAPMKEVSAPVPTTRPPLPEPAENAGDNKVDLKTPPVPNAKPSNSDAAAANSSDKPQPQIDPTPNDVKEVNKEETEVDQPKEVASIPQQKPADVTPPPQPDVKPEEQAKPEEPPKPDAEALPDNVPTPVAKPQVKPPEPKAAEKPPEKPQDQPKTAEKPTDKKKADKKQEVAKSASSMKSDFNADEISALLNKTDPSAGGAKRSTQEASLGAKKSTGGSKLSMSEMDALRSAIAGNWSVIPGMEGASEVRIKVHMKLDPDGNLIGQPEVEATGGDNDATRRALAGGAYRAIMKSAPFSTLPKDKYDAWNEVVVNFDPSDLGI